MVSSQVRMVGSAELQVVQATLRVDGDRDTAIRTAVQKPLDWQYVQRLAKCHGVMPLVYKRFKEVAPDLVPLDAMQQMAAWQKAHELHVFQMTADLIKVVRSLECENIPVLCLKGPVLATLLYGDPAMRDFGDLDILVKQSDYVRAKGILRRMGVVQAYPDRVAMYRHDSLIVGSSYLEIHWQITTKEFPQALEIDSLFTRSREVSINGQILHTLGTEDLVIHACQHGTQHCWGKLRYLADFISVLHTVDTTRWDAVLATARGQGLYRPLLVSMEICRGIAGLALPKKLTRAVAYSPIVQLSGRLIRSCICHKIEPGADQFDQMALNLLVAENDKYSAINGLLATMFTPTKSDYEWIRLPNSLRWLYPGLKPVRRIKQGAVLLWSRIICDQN